MKIKIYPMQLFLFVMSIFSSYAHDIMQQNLPQNQALSNDPNINFEHSNYPHVQMSLENLYRNADIPFVQSNTTPFNTPQEQVQTLNPSFDDFYGQANFLSSNFSGQQGVTHTLDYDTEARNVAETGKYDPSSDHRQRQIKNPIQTPLHLTNSIQNSYQMSIYQCNSNELHNEQIFDTIDPAKMAEIFEEIMERVPERDLEDFIQQYLRDNAVDGHTNEISLSHSENNSHLNQPCVHKENSLPVSISSSISTYQNHLNPSLIFQEEPSRQEIVSVENNKVIDTNHDILDELKEMNSFMHLKVLDNLSLPTTYENYINSKFIFYKNLETKNSDEIIFSTLQTLYQTIRLNSVSTYPYINILEFHIRRIEQNYIFLSYEKKDLDDLDKLCYEFGDFLKKNCMSIQYDNVAEEKDVGFVARSISLKFKKRISLESDFSLRFNVCIRIISEFEKSLSNLRIDEISKNTFYTSIIQEIQLINQKHEILPELYSIPILVSRKTINEKEFSLAYVLLRTIRILIEEDIIINLDRIKTCNDIIFLILSEVTPLERKITLPNDQRSITMNMCFMVFYLINCKNRQVLLHKLKENTNDILAHFKISRKLLIDCFIVLQHLLVIRVCNYKKVDNLDEIKKCFLVFKERIMMHKGNLRIVTYPKVKYVSIRLQENGLFNSINEDWLPRVVWSF